MSKKLTSAEIALYWFFKAYEAEHGVPYTITTQQKLADDCFLHNSTITKVKGYSELIKINKREQSYEITKELK